MTAMTARKWLEVSHVDCSKNARESFHWHRGIILSAPILN